MYKGRQVWPITNLKIEANKQMNEVLELPDKDLIAMSNMLNWITEKMDKMNEKMENFKIIEIYKNIIK